MRAPTVRLKQSEIRESLTVRVKLPPLLTARIRAGAWLIRLAASVAGVGIKVELEDGDGS